jgi:hypothetical protein
MLYTDNSETQLAMVPIKKVTNVPPYSVLNSNGFSEAQYTICLALYGKNDNLKI